jgi:hypothetical protein
VAREERFVLEEVAGGWQARCRDCGTSSPVVKSKHKATKWSQRHAIAEFDMDLPTMVQFMRSR